jgi:POT family proton-dependent oligopeptide transporter
MPSSSTATLFGHPRGLATLFFTEMWERFSYYGMRALLILFMTDAAHGGLAMGNEQASAIYGLYVFGVYALALPGGWIADRLIGQRKAVLYGGILIALGHYCLAVPGTVAFYLGLCLIVLGTGLLKPNVSAIVGDLYEERDARRDAGFSIFYMGINIGAFAGPLVCGFVGEPREGVEFVDWHYGFAAAGVGMTLALVQYVLGQQHLRGAGELKEDSAEPARLADARRKLVVGGIVAVGIAAAVALASWTGALAIDLTTFAHWTGTIVAGLAAVYFAWTIAVVCRDGTERRRVALCALLFVGAALFWSGFEQAGSSMNLFARDLTDRQVLGMEVPAGWLQSVNAIFIILLAPVVGMVWQTLGARSPSIPVKFGLGLLLLGLGFLVLVWGSARLPEGAAGADVAQEDKLGMRWLVATYFLHTVGELCLSPVGLSSMTKLAPGRLVGQMMGTWFMGSALGNLIAGLAASDVGQVPVGTIFSDAAWIALASGAAFIILARPMNWLAAGTR